MPGRSSRPMSWGILLHLSYNMWKDRQPRLEMVFDHAVWKDLLVHAAAAGLNMVVIDLGDAIKYESHPEIAVSGAWTPKRLKRELAAVRGLGLEPIPKLNFSACHDNWLGPYARCVSTETYYDVCRDLIAEVCALFDEPRLFHLGMDEETARHQRRQDYVVVRQFGLWWHDLLFLVDQVRRGGARPWLWSDYLWEHREEFFHHMPRSVLQSNWYYGKSFRKTIRYVEAYLDLEARGYDQMPTGSNWSHEENFARTVTWCRKNISPRYLLGFLQTTWRSTTPESHEHNLQAIELAGKAREKLLRRT